MEQLIALAEKEIIVGRNSFLKLEGTVDTNIYFIESGSLRIYMLNEGEEQIIRFGYKSDFIVSLDSFLTGKVSEFYIQAIKKSVVKVIPKSVFDNFLQENEQHKILWLKILEDLIVQQIEREKDLLYTSPKARYERVVNRSPRLFQEIPGKHIANYLRMSPETLSRLKKS
ncbi:MAG: Crp/Fnr family transcriptional regulator [Saprospiraceae bacterium]|nr:Crp/Fnr family transcriptional regulator [Saprospiraceae bacterium]